MSERKYTRSQLEKFVIHCLVLSRDYKPTDLHKTFLEIFNASPMFRNGIFFPWVQDNDLKIIFEGHPLYIGSDFNISDDGQTITLNSPLP